MAQKFIAGETPGGPAELQAALDTALAGVTPASGSDVTVAIASNMNMTRWVICYRT